MLFDCPAEGSKCLITSVFHSSFKMNSLELFNLPFSCHKPYNASWQAGSEGMQKLLSPTPKKQQYKEMSALHPYFTSLLHSAPLTGAVN